MNANCRALLRTWKARLTGHVELRVEIAYDSEACIWYVAHTDIPGLHLEGESAGELINKLEQAAPGMIELNREWIAERFGLRRRKARPGNIHTEFVTPLAATC